LIVFDGWWLIVGGGYYAVVGVPMPTKRVFKKKALGRSESQDVIEIRAYVLLAAIVNRRLSTLRLSRKGGKFLLIVSFNRDAPRTTDSHLSRRERCIGSIFHIKIKKRLSVTFFVNSDVILNVEKPRTLHSR
jgi:hypothetical protein